jgi:prepilin signal peptidase PulO-like enzyme (type II secretory pathway)
LNVLAVRYDPDRFVVTRESVGGRSRCPQCSRTLRWFELVPFVSFLIQRGRCRSCGTRIGLHHPAAELASGLIVAFVPLVAGAGGGWAGGTLWTLVFLVLLLLSLIDIRLRLIPDEATALLAALGIIIAFLAPAASLFGGYASLFGLGGANVWVNHIAAALAAALLFGALIAVTRGRGMGLGDLKLAAALGLVFGWPDIVLVVMFAFIIGALFGAGAIAAKRKTMKSAVPFGPFLAIGAALAFFCGSTLVNWYFGFLQL